MKVIFYRMLKDREKKAKLKTYPTDMPEIS